MKKLISMVLALAVVFSSFAVIVKADKPTEKITVLTPAVDDEDVISEVIEELIDNEDIEAESDVDGYTLYQIDVYIEGLALSRTNESTFNGTLLSSFELSASGDMSKFLCSYINTKSYPYLKFTPGPTGFALGWDASLFKGSKTFPTKGQTVDTEEPTLFYTAYVFVKDGASFTVVDDATSLGATPYTSGSPGIDVTYKPIDHPASITFGSSGGGGSTPVITEADDGYALENKYVENKADLTDLQGKPVELKKNYGIAKFTENIDTTAKDYFLHVVDDQEVPAEADLPIDFAKQGFDFESATVSFFAIVRSATHKVVSMTLKAVAKSE